jgi:hypothetical protein
VLRHAPRLRTRGDDIALFERKHTGDSFHQTALARAIRAEKGNDAAFVNFEVNVLLSATIDP